MALSDLLNYVVRQDEILSSALASYQTWGDGNAHCVTLDDIAGKLESAKTEVSHKTFYGY